jgi:hypothetical protein
LGEGFGAGLDSGAPNRCHFPYILEEEEEEEEEEEDIEKYTLAF